MKLNKKEGKETFIYTVDWSGGDDASHERIAAVPGAVTQMLDSGDAIIRKYSIHLEQQMTSDEWMEQRKKR